jgi:hypothetical protein
MNNVLSMVRGNMKLPILRWLSFVEEVVPVSPDGGMPLRKVGAVAVVRNPMAGQFGEDLREMIEASAVLGRTLSERALAAMRPYDVVSYGKGALAGLAGQQEHANALITTTFATPLREAVGGGRAWISSFTKRVAPGATIDIPLAHKDALYVRSHYDGMTLTLPDGPQADEIAVILCVANRGRLDARVGGLRAEDISGQDGLS